MEIKVKIHPLTAKEHRKEVRKNAKKLGLDKIDYTKAYTMHKTKAKNPSERGYADSFFAGLGSICLLGNHEVIVLFIDTHDSWFKTSEILSCKEINGKFEIETRNSIYVLEEV